MTDIDFARGIKCSIILQPYNMYVIKGNISTYSGVISVHGCGWIAGQLIIVIKTNQHALVHVCLVWSILIRFSTLTFVIYRGSAVITQYHFWNNCQNKQLTRCPRSQDMEFVLWGQGFRQGIFEMGTYDPYHWNMGTWVTFLVSVLLYIVISDP